MRTANNSATRVCHGHIPTNLHILLPTICRNEINDADNLSQKSGIAELGQETNRDRPSRWLRERNSGEPCRAALVRNPARAICRAIAINYTTPVSDSTTYLRIPRLYLSRPIVGGRK